MNIAPARSLHILLKATEEFLAVSARRARAISTGMGKYVWRNTLTFPLRRTRDTRPKKKKARRHNAPDARGKKTERLPQTRASPVIFSSVAAFRRKLPIVKRNDTVVERGSRVRESFGVEIDNQRKFGTYTESGARAGNSRRF